jgi:hypothetical protein
LTEWTYRAATLVTAFAIPEGETLRARAASARESPASFPVKGRKRGLRGDVGK